VRHNRRWGDPGLKMGETGLNPVKADVLAQGAAFYYACVKNGFADEADEFAEWFFETFDTDLES